MRLLKKALLISSSVAFILFSAYVLYAFVIARQIRDRTLAEIIENHRAENPLPDICESVLRRDAEACRKYLLRGDDPDQRCTIVVSRIGETITLAQMTPLMISAQQNNAEIFELLLRFGANVRCKDSYNRDALMIASWFSSKDIVHWLLTCSENIKWLSNKDVNGNDALFYAQLSGSPEIITMLREYGFYLKEDARPMHIPGTEPKEEVPDEIKEWERLLKT